MLVLVSRHRRRRRRPAAAEEALQLSCTTAPRPSHRHSLSDVLPDELDLLRVRWSVGLGERGTKPTQEDGAGNDQRSTHTFPVEPTACGDPVAFCDDNPATPPPLEIAMSSYLLSARGVVAIMSTPARACTCACACACARLLLCGAICQQGWIPVAQRRHLGSIAAMCHVGQAAGCIRLRSERLP